MPAVCAGGAVLTPDDLVAGGCRQRVRELETQGVIYAPAVTLDTTGWYSVPLPMNIYTALIVLPYLPRVSDTTCALMLLWSPVCLVAFAAMAAQAFLAWYIYEYLTISDPYLQCGDWSGVFRLICAGVFSSICLDAILLGTFCIQKWISLHPYWTTGMEEVCSQADGWLLYRSVEVEDKSRGVTQVDLTIAVTGFSRSYRVFMYTVLALKLATQTAILWSGLGYIMSAPSNEETLYASVAMACAARLDAPVYAFLVGDHVKNWLGGLPTLNVAGHEDPILLGRASLRDACLGILGPYLLIILIAVVLFVLYMYRCA